MPYNYKTITKRLKYLGYEQVRQKGSHVLFSNGLNLIPVPHHGGKDITPLVERSIIKSTGLTKDAFKNLV